MPEKNGLTLSYEQKDYDQKALKNQLLPVVSNRVQSEQVAFINQDLTLYLSELDEAKTLTFTQGANRKIFLFVIEGDLTLNAQTKLKKRDSVRIIDVTELKIDANSKAKLMLIDLP